MLFHTSSVFFFLLGVVRSVRSLRLDNDIAATCGLSVVPPLWTLCCCHNKPERGKKANGLRIQPLTSLLGHFAAVKDGCAPPLLFSPLLSSLSRRVTSYIRGRGEGIANDGIMKMSFSSAVRPSGERELCYAQSSSSSSSPSRDVAWS